MNKQDLDSIVENYIVSLQTALKEPTLNRELTDFPIDPDKAFFLLLPLLNENAEMDGSVKEVMIAIGAIQAALDIHDWIDRQEAVSSDQQLTVLAGDHFSGIHYRILANIGEFPLIRKLSQTIARINEQKAALQMDLRLSAERLLDRLTVIETACISTFYERYGYDHYRPLAEYALTYIRLNRMDDSVFGKVSGVEASVVRQAIELLTSRWESADGQRVQLRRVLAETVQERLHTEQSPS